MWCRVVALASMLGNQKQLQSRERKRCGGRSELLMTMMQCEKRTEEYLGYGRQAAKGREPGR
jgi:hypothetical protein